MGFEMHQRLEPLPSNPFLCPFLHSPPPLSCYYRSTHSLFNIIINRKVRKKKEEKKTYLTRLELPFVVRRP